MTELAILLTLIWIMGFVFLPSLFSLLLAGLGFYLGGWLGAAVLFVVGISLSEIR